MLGENLSIQRGETLAHLPMWQFDHIMSRLQEKVMNHYDFLTRSRAPYRLYFLRFCTWIRAKGYLILEIA